MGHRLDKEGIQPFLVGFQKHEASQRHGREWRIGNGLYQCSNKPTLMSVSLQSVRVTRKTCLVSILTGPRKQQRCLEDQAKGRLPLIDCYQAMSHEVSSKQTVPYRAIVPSLPNLTMTSVPMIYAKSSRA